MPRFVTNPERIKPLTIPPKGARYKGIQIYCKHCRRWITNDMKSCSHPESQQYRVLIHVPGTTANSKSKVLPTRDYRQAVLMRMEFEQELKQNNFTEPVQGLQEFNRILIDNMSIYQDYLECKGPLAELNLRVKSLSYRNTVKEVFKQLLLSLNNQGYCEGSFLIDSFNTKIISKYLDDVRKKGYKPSYYNKFISYLDTFYTFIQEKVELKNVDNPFTKFPRETVYYNPISASENEFYALLKIITEDEGEIVYKNGVKKNLYRPWLIDAFIIAVLTGRRREELVIMRFSDIEEDSDGLPEIIYCSDLKVEHMKNKKIHPNPVPITEEFRKLLYKIGYEKYKMTDRYLFGNDEDLSRMSMVAFLTHSFTHFYRKLNTGKSITFKSLRKTYATAADNFMNGNGKALTGQASNNILDINYRDKIESAKNAAKSGFSVFRNIDQNIDHLSK